MIPIASANNITIDNSTSIQDNVNAAFDDDIIYLDSGNYKESGIEIDKNITLEGKGSAGDVIIDGENKNAIIKINSVSDVKIKNITFTNGFNTENGGVIECLGGGHVTLENCRFISNSAYGYGGCIFVEGINHQNANLRQYGLLNIINCTFTDNYALVDGGAFDSKITDVYVRDSIFERNTAGRDGGALAVYGMGTTTVENSIFKNNTAEEWAGGLHNWLGKLVVINSTVINNTAGTYGGAFYSCGELTVTKSKIINNTAKDTAGLVYAHKEEPKVNPVLIFNDNEIVGNTAPNVDLVYYMPNIEPNKSNFDNNYWGNISPNSTNWNDEFITNNVTGNPASWYELADTTIISCDSTRAYNSGYDFMASFTNKFNQSLADTAVTVKVNDKSYNMTTDCEGNVKLNLKLAVGSYSIVLINPITGQNATNTLEILPRIIGNKDLSKDYLDSKTYKAQIIGDDGTPVKAGVSVNIVLNGVKSTVKTDKNGYITKTINLVAGKYKISADYKGYKVSNKVTVKQILKSKNVSVKVKKTINLQATLKYSNGKVLKNKKVKFIFKGKTYTAKTNKKGIAKVSIKNKFKAGKYTVKIQYEKQTIKQTVKIKK